MDSLADLSGRVWQATTGEFRRELGRMLQLRRELATLEVKHDHQLIRHCLLLGSLGAVLALAGLPLLLQIAAQGLANLTPLSATAWTLILGSTLAVPGLLLVAGAIKKFRADFRGLRDTRAELAEDLIWLHEWLPSATGEHEGDADRTHDDEAD
jgi:uncharacterized membrane protein YqjE